MKEAYGEGLATHALLETLRKLGFACSQRALFLCELCSSSQTRSKSAVLMLTLYPSAKNRQPCLVFFSFFHSDELELNTLGVAISFARIAHQPRDH